MVVRIVVGLALTAVASAIGRAAAVAGCSGWRGGQPAPERIAAVRAHPGRDGRSRRPR